MLVCRMSSFVFLAADTLLRVLMYISSQYIYQPLPFVHTTFLYTDLIKLE